MVITSSGRRCPAKQRTAIYRTPSLYHLHFQASSKWRLSMLPHHTRRLRSRSAPANVNESWPPGYFAGFVDLVDLGLSVGFFGDSACRSFSLLRFIVS